MSEIVRVTVLGEAHAVVAPKLLVVREELLSAYLETEGKLRPRLRVLCACLGLCTRLGRQVKATLAASGYDVLAYGGEVYSELRAKGARAEELATAGYAIVPLLAEGLVTERGIEDARGNSGGGGESSTGSSSATA